MSPPTFQTWGRLSRLIPVSKLMVSVGIAAPLKEAWVSNTSSPLLEQTRLMVAMLWVWSRIGEKGWDAIVRKRVDWMLMGVTMLGEKRVFAGDEWIGESLPVL